MPLEGSGQGGAAVGGGVGLGCLNGGAGSVETGLLPLGERAGQDGEATSLLRKSLFGCVHICIRVLLSSICRINSWNQCSCITEYTG